MPRRKYHQPEDYYIMNGRAFLVGGRSYGVVFSTKIEEAKPFKSVWKVIRFIERYIPSDLKPYCRIYVRTKK